MENAAPLLKSHDLMARLRPEHIQKLASAARVRSLVPGEAICREGLPATAFFLLVEGNGRVTRTGPDGKQQILGLVRPGSLFGLVGIGDRAPRPVTVASTGPGILLEIPANLLSGDARSVEGHFVIALREIVALALDLQMRAANQQLLMRADELAERSVDNEWEAGTQGGWKQPEA
ncbi:MAG TPA: cyclic nucleotide-binding domain-containing protein [Myxococcota bacterium]|nr:cyclic nucleotide-binding domain-containing protein [Myxococcota bacterium]